MTGKRAVKFLLLGFVGLSVAAAVYKMAGAPCCAQSEPAAEPAPAAVEPAPAPKNTAAAKTATVYYFYTNTRCSSCTTIEAYTRAAVEKYFKHDYKGWRVTFRGVNTDEQANAHFVRDYWLNSKSVVVQRYSGDKPDRWARLDKVWTLLGDKDAFADYVAGETRKLLDEK
ncbi:MAG: hypothetical protein A2049_00920 [Elusimicrobia bacterium GWA2_62_23]|nr:MAG: hypothetical protein A2049_00920 [Elusimicrobia bacterium GWA2_62_23]